MIYLTPFNRFTRFSKKVLITKEMKVLWAEKTCDLINIGAGATIFGQFVSDSAYSWQLSIFGLFLIVVGYIISYIFLQTKP